MKTLRASFLAPLFGLLLSVAACSGQAPTDGSAQSESAAFQTAESGKHFARKVHGPASLISIALRDPSIQLSDAQRTTIEAARKTLAPKGGEKKHFDKAALAAAVRAGNVDALMAKPEANTEAKAEKKAALSNALNVLHSTLTKEQRVALVAAAEKRHEAKKDGVAKHAGHKKHGKKSAEGGGKKTAFASLGLTPDQKAQIEAKLAPMKPAVKTDADRDAMKAKFVAMKKERSERLQTFTADSFDVAAFLARPEGSTQKVAQHGGRMAKLAAVVSVLTPEQREKLAVQIEQGHQKPAQKPAAL